MARETLSQGDSLAVLDYLPVCLACHAASIRFRFSASMALYQSLAPVRSFLWPVTCPRFMLCSSVVFRRVAAAHQLAPKTPCRLGPRVAPRLPDHPGPVVLSFLGG